MPAWAADARFGVMSTLVLYHDFASAFCRLALPMAREASAAAGLGLELVPFELFPTPLSLPAPGNVLAPELEAARYRAEELKLALMMPSRTPRTRKAHEAVAHARPAGLDLAMAEALYDAVWQRDLDIARLDVLGELAESIGLDGATLHVALGVDTHERAVVGAQLEAEAAGITGVPTLRLGGSELVGLVTPPELAAWLSSVRR